jgi:spermidine/putrescine transport system ATP-binding protein
VTHSHSEAFAMADRVVIMNEGRVQQVGAPQEIYRRASNQFVAEFVGGNNILHGTVTGLEAGAITLDTQAGRVRSTNLESMSAGMGGNATLVVPADRVELAPASDASPVGAGLNEVSARVATVEFVGSTVTVFLETESGGELRAQKSLHSVEGTPLAVGQPVVARWSPSHGYFLNA